MNDEKDSALLTIGTTGMLRGPGGVSTRVAHAHVAHAHPKQNSSAPRKMAPAVVR
jgi:hypothetical protein